MPDSPGEEKGKGGGGVHSDREKNSSVTWVTLVLKCVTHGDPTHEEGREEGGSSAAHREGVRTG
jgi:hypothetical protein